MAGAPIASNPAPAPSPRRASPPLKTEADRLGPLIDLAGTWVGGGFNLISLPDFDSHPPSTGPRAFRLKLSATRETLQFIPIGGPVPNRGRITDLGTGSGQLDIQLYGLTYLQRVSDAVTNEALHIEPGIWLNVPATNVLPHQPATVVRLATIPHGDSLVAQGNSTNVAGGPIIGAVDSTPTGPGILPGYLDPFLNPPLPPGFKPPFVKNLNLALQEAIHGQDITNTVVLVISTTPSGGIVNIPFIVQNANATSLDAVFWIETVQQPDGSGSFMQLQYTQTVILNFLGIDWPHISVATLVKQ
jgi:hypothetical protein